MKTYPLLTVRGLVAGYRSGVPVIGPIDISVDEHDVLCVLGSNGAGKSTMLACIAGAVRPWGGYIIFAGEDIAGVSAHALISRGAMLVPSGRRVFAEQTVTENLLLGAHVFRKDRRRIGKAVASMFERFEVLANKAKMPAGALSGGEQQLLSIARGLMSRPKLLLIDEPSMGLDPHSVKMVFDLIEEVRDDGTTMVLVEKSAQLASRVANKMIVLASGRVVMSGPASQVANDPGVQEAYLGMGTLGRPGT
ncbi:MAG: ABC transporter ATP-binding protein [Actinomycetota bacterium]|nr:ABC transporter ATP-binding protein [Actinomycetota bacterium]